MRHRYSRDPQVERSLRYSVRDGVAWSLMFGAGESYLQAFAVFLKATTAQITLLGALPPLIGSVAQLTSAWVAGYAIRRKSLIFGGVLLQSGAWLPIIALAFLPGGSPVALLTAAVVLYYTGAQFAAPPWSSLISDLVPERRRGRFFGRRTQLMSIMTFVSLGAAGLALESFEQLTLAHWGFAAIFAVALAARIYSLAQLMRMHEPLTRLAPFTLPPLGGLLDRMRGSDFIRFALFVGFMNLAVAIASPFFTLYMLRDLRFSYLEFTVVEGETPLNLSVAAEASGNARAFSSLSDYDSPSADVDRPEHRSLTSAVVPWAIPAEEDWGWGGIRRTPDIASILQEIVDREDWSAGNALAFIVRDTGSGTGNGHRSVASIDGQAARLVVTLGAADPSALFITRVATPDDDAGTNPLSCSYGRDNEVYFGECQSGPDLTSGFRFSNLVIPRGSRIAEAYLEFTVDGPYDDEELGLSIAGEATGNAAAFDAAFNPPANDPARPENRPNTGAVVPWEIPSTEHWEFHETRRTPDLTAIVQEIVDRDDWCAGNAMAFIVRNARPARGGWRHRRVFAVERSLNGAADPLEVTRLIVRLAPIAHVAVDLKPGSQEDRISPRSRGVVPIAILSSADFDARTVEPASVWLGGACPVGEAHLRGHVEDANGDGRTDLVLHFNTGALLASVASPTGAALTGRTSTGNIRSSIQLQPFARPASQGPAESEDTDLEGSTHQNLPPGQLVLKHTSPNPARGDVTFHMGLPKAGNASLRVFDLMGRQVSSVFEGDLPVGWTVRTWSGCDVKGRIVSSGIYVALLETDEAMARRSFVIVR